MTDAAAGLFAATDNIKTPAAANANTRAKVEKRFAIRLMRMISPIRAA